MNATLHLFRHDVRRLRWWLAAWAAFWVWALWPGQSELAAASMDVSWFISGWGESKTRQVLVLNISHAALAAALFALLFVPHGPDDPRLYWRTRPVTPRAMLQAKVLFAGLFLVGFPMFAEFLFWLRWLPTSSVVEFLPGMFGERLAWSGGLAALMVLGGREPRRYQLVVLGVLGLGYLWMLACEQLTYRTWLNAREEDSPLPVLAAQGWLGQLWEFATRPGSKALFAPDWVGWIGAVSLGVGGWLVVGCRYQMPRWRAVRLAVEGTLLVALLAGFVGLHAAQFKAWLRPADERRYRSYDERLRNLPMNGQAERLEVRLLSATHFGTNRTWGVVEGITFWDVPATHTSVRVELAVEGNPRGTLAFAELRNLRGANRRRTNREPLMGGLHIDFPWGLRLAAGREQTRLPERLEPFAGYRLHTVAYPPWEIPALENEAAEELMGQPVTAVADVTVSVVQAEVAAVLPLAKEPEVRFGERRLSLRFVDRTQYGSVNASEWELFASGRNRADSSWHSFELRPEPDLLVVRNPVTKTGFIVPAVEVNQMWQQSHRVAAPMSPTRAIQFAERSVNLSRLAARFGFGAGWLSQSELVCVRLTMAGHAYRKMTWENFRLESAAP